MSEPKNVFQRLLDVQHELVAPREVDGKFGKARSAEQILEAAKPVCFKHGLYLYTTDTVEQVGDRNYITATAHVINTVNPEERHEASASAWENQVELNKYGAPILDTSQVSGKTGSYSKKYALQNLFAIDDTKDADSQDNTAAPAKPAVGHVEAVKEVFGVEASPLATDIQKRQIKAFLTALDIPEAKMGRYLTDNFGVDPGSMTKTEAVAILKELT